MPWYDYIECDLVIGNIAIHVGALSLMRRREDGIKNKNQRIIIAALCGCELSGVLYFGIIFICKLLFPRNVFEVMLLFIVILGKPGYFFIMGLLLMDRFLAFYLNIRNNIYVTSSKLIKLIIGAVMTSLTTAIILTALVATQKVTKQRLNKIIHPLHLMIDVAYIFLTATTYVYMFILYRQQSRMKKNNQCIRSKDQFNLLVPSLIIVIFIAFNITPDLLRGAIMYGILPFNEIFIRLSFMFYLIGCLMDPLIYIFYSIYKRNH